jgi:multiple sugar transport system permease protein
MRRRAIAGQLATYLVLLPATVVMIAPFYWALATALKPVTDVFVSPPKWIPDPATLANFNDVFTLIHFNTYFVNSIVVSASIVLLNVLFGTAAAYAFAKLRFPGRDALFFVFLLTLMVPFQVNLIPLYRIMVVLHQIVPFLGEDTYFGLIAPSAIQVLGIFLMRQYIRTIPDELLEAARMDGASEFRILRTVVFPLATPAMATLAIITFLSAWNDFLWPLIVTSSDSMRTLQPGLALLARKNTVNWAQSMAGVIVAAGPMIAVFFVLQRRFIEGLTAGSVKDAG